MLKPIVLNEIKIPFWIRLLPFSKYSYIKRQINNILKYRDPQEVEKAWQDVGVSYKDAEKILNIIAKYCDWKSTRFIPSDECLCVFIDHDLELGCIAAISEIEKSYPQIKSEQLYEWLPQSKDLLDLIRFVIGESREG